MQRVSFLFIFYYSYFKKDSICLILYLFKVVTLLFFEWIKLFIYKFIYHSIKIQYIYYLSVLILLKALFEILLCIRLESGTVPTLWIMAPLWLFLILLIIELTSRLVSIHNKSSVHSWKISFNLLQTYPTPICIFMFYQKILYLSILEK